MKKYKKTLSRIKYIFKDKNDCSDGYDDDYPRIKIICNNDLRLEGTLKNHDIIMLFRSVCNDRNNTINTILVYFLINICIYLNTQISSRTLIKKNLNKLTLIHFARLNFQNASFYSCAKMKLNCLKTCKHETKRIKP